MDIIYTTLKSHIYPTICFVLYEYYPKVTGAITNQVQPLQILAAVSFKVVLVYIYGLVPVFFPFLENFLNVTSILNWKSIEKPYSAGHFSYIVVNFLPEVRIYWKTLAFAGWQSLFLHYHKLPSWSENLLINLTICRAAITFLTLQ